MTSPSLIKLPSVKLRPEELSLLKSIGEGTPPIQDSSDERRKLHWLGLIEQKNAPAKNLRELQAQERSVLAQIKKHLGERDYDRARDACWDARKIANDMKPRQRYFITAKGTAILRQSLSPQRAELRVQREANEHPE